MADFGFNFSDAQAQLASIADYAGDPFTYGVTALKGFFNPSAELHSFNEQGGMTVHYSPTVKVSRAQLATPVIGTGVQVDGSYFRVHDIKPDNLSWILLLVPVEQL